MNPSSFSREETIMFTWLFLCEADSDLDYNTTSRVILNKRMRYLQTVLEQFWRCWKKEYLLEFVICVYIIIIDLVLLNVKVHYN